MRYTLVSINNTDSVGNKFVGTTNDFSFDGSIFYFGLLYSSKVRSITFNGDTMTIQTKNSKYTFEKETK